MPILDWLNKEEALREAQKAPYRVLDEAPGLSYGDSSAQNMLIQGDNLESLKALLPFYAGQIKCVYIDPPYNTQSAFEHYDDNLEHSMWLTMMYPRLELLRDLLSEEGTIWMSVDDNEAHYLRVLADEIFGRKNFVANVIWEKKYAPQNDARWLSDSHDHILCYAKNKDTWRPNLLPRTEAMDKRYKNPDNDSRGPWKPADFSVKTYSKTTDYPITLPSGRVVNPPESRCWVVTKERCEELVKDNRVWFGKNGNNVPSLKKFLSEVKQGTVSKTIWYRNEVGDNQEAKKEIKVLNNEDVFGTPKPERLIQRIISLSTNPGDWVLDSFLGSGTTSAVAHKMKRNWIGVEIGDHCQTHCFPRLKAVVDGEQGGISEVENWKGGGGFKFYRLGNTIFDTEGRINPAISFESLSAYIWFKETGLPRAKRKRSSLIGSCKNVSYYLLFNGILGDKRLEHGNVLTNKVLKELPEGNDAKVIYGETSRLSSERLKSLNIIFKQIPYDIGV